MMEDRQRGNIVHYPSNRYRKISMGVMEEEIHTLVAAFDFEFVIADMKEGNIETRPRIESRVDRKTVFNVVKDAETTEQRLKIDILDLKESYRKGELSSLEWIPGRTNMADALIKEVLSERSPLWKLMTYKLLNTTSLGLEVVNWKHQSTRAPESSTTKTQTLNMHSFAPMQESRTSKRTMSKPTVCR